MLLCLRHLRLLLKRLLVLLFLYSLCRLIFFLFNYSYFSTSDYGEILTSFIHGIRFDAAAIAITNSPFIALSSFQFFFSFKKWYSQLLRFIFFIVNGFALFTNCVDFIYFRFVMKRTSSDFFSMFALGNDMQNTIPGMIADFWYVLLILFFLIYIMIRFYGKPKDFYTTDSNIVGNNTSNDFLDKKIINKTNFRTGRQWIVAILLYICVVALSVIIARGGIQYRPLGILAASKYAGPENAPLVLNTPFVLIKTWNKTQLNMLHYMDDDECIKYFSLHQQLKSSEPFRPYNVVIIILESFSKEYIGSLNDYAGYTPFLDSLIMESCTFTNAYANAKKSIEGMPAILAGMPSLMNEPFITSPYSGNNIGSIASALKQKGYTSSFFHGGNNGTMGFDNFVKAAGFDFYKGRKEYGAHDYDGSWGVYDHKFYEYFLKELNRMKQPFVSCIFSLTSHHPYSIPEQFKNTFPKGTLAAHESIGYADYSLRLFIEAASRQSWFDSTLFVITSDHTGPSDKNIYQNKRGMFAIPVLFYHRRKIAARQSARVAQQCDIMPSILDYLHYEKPFSAFGQSVFDTSTTAFAACFPYDNFQLITGKYLYQFDGERSIALYDYTSDTLLQENILTEKPLEANKSSLLLKSVLQQYNNSMILNNLAPQK